MFGTLEILENVRITRGKEGTKIKYLKIFLELCCAVKNDMLLNWQKQSWIFISDVYDIIMLIESPSPGPGLE